jgi:hypothetical protein
MTEKRLFVLAHPEARRRAAQCIAEAPAGWKVEVKPPSRSLDQNALLWPLLTEIAHQVDWYGQKLTEDEWKDVFTAALKKQKVVPGLDGGFVVCGQRTSKMPKAVFSELIELIYAFGAQHNVKFKETA